MRFLLFNLAVVAALFYLFNADRGGADLVNDLREDPVQTIREELESLARDIAEGREGVARTVPQALESEAVKVKAEAAQSPQILAPTSTSAKMPEQPTEPATAQALDADQPRGGAAADSVVPLPVVEDPAVARRRAEVLDGAKSAEDGRGGTAVEAGPPMSPEERLRKLYSLAEEMELLYVSKTTR